MNDRHVIIEIEALVDTEHLDPDDLDICGSDRISGTYLIRIEGPDDRDTIDDALEIFHDNVWISNRDSFEITARYAESDDLDDPTHRLID